MIGNVKVTSTGYDPNGPRVNDPTLGPDGHKALKCGHCGFAYNPDDPRWGKQTPHVSVVTHDYPPFCRAVCPGSKSEPWKASDPRLVAVETVDAGGAK